MEKIQRGYEIYARDLFNLLKNEPGLELTLIKGNGIRNKSEKVVFNVPRGSFFNRLLSFISRKSRLYVEFVSFDLFLIPTLLSGKFDVFYVLEASIYKFLAKWRKLTGGKFKLIHFTGGQLGALPATSLDYLHHVSPAYLEQAKNCGFLPENQFLIPHFFEMNGTESQVAPDESKKLRSKLKIPAGMPVVLSVGNIDTEVKRMDYLIRECAALSSPVFVLLLGQHDASTAKVYSLAEEKLGSNRFIIKTVPRKEIWKYYAIADVFVLASLCEGFGLVFLEALAAGLPVIAHDHEVSRYVLESHGYFADLSKPERLKAALEKILAEPKTESIAEARKTFVFQRYGAHNLKQRYAQMLQQVCGDLNCNA